MCDKLYRIIQYDSIRVRHREISAFTKQRKTLNIGTIVDRNPYWTHIVQLCDSVNKQTHKQTHKRTYNMIISTYR